MDSKKEIKVSKVEEGEAGKARKLVTSILADLVDGAVGEGRGEGRLRGRRMVEPRQKVKLWWRLRGKLRWCV